MTLELNQREGYAAARKGGLGPVAAECLVANAMGESLEDPTDVHADPSTRDRAQHAHGVFCWGDARASRIAKKFGAMPQLLSVGTQFEVALWEIQNYYPKTWTALQSVNPRVVMDGLVRDFERPAHADVEVERRLRLLAKLPKDLEARVALPPPPQVPPALEPLIVTGPWTTCIAILAIWYLVCGLAHAPVPLFGTPTIHEPWLWVFAIITLLRMPDPWHTATEPKKENEMSAEFEMVLQIAEALVGAFLNVQGMATGHSQTIDQLGQLVQNQAAQLEALKAQLAPPPVDQSAAARIEQLKANLAKAGVTVG